MQGRPTLQDVPIVVLTAKELTADERQMLSGRTKQIIAKQGSTSVDLIEAIRRCVRRHPAAPSTMAPIG
jgi:CheY-like chemotaxis protein